MEGFLGIDVLGRRESRYFVVLKDNMLMFAGLDDVRKRQTQLRIRACDVRGLKISEDTITVVMDAQHVSLKVSDPDTLERWFSSLKDMVKTNEDFAVDRTKAPVHEGIIKIDKKQNKLEDRYVALYMDRFEMFLDQQDRRHGKPTLVISHGELDAFELQNANFMLEVMHTVHKFYVWRAIDMRDWAKAWYEVLGLSDADVRIKTKWNRRELRARTCKEWVAHAQHNVVAGKVYQGPVGWEYPDGRVEPKYLIVCKDRLEFFSELRPTVKARGDHHDTIPLKDMRSLKVVDDGFCIDARSHVTDEPLRIKLRLGEPELLDTWVFHLKNVIDSYHSGKGAFEGEPAPQMTALRCHPLEAIPPNSLFATKGEGMQSELKHPIVAQWLARQNPLHSGLLGIMRGGEMALRFFVLFKDRLDSWGRPMDAASGFRPTLHIPIADVRSIETVSSGLIVNCRGKKIGFHANSNNELHDWSGALMQALAPSSKPQPAAASRSASVPPKARSRRAPKARARSTERAVSAERSDGDDYPHSIDRRGRQLSRGLSR